MKNSICFTGTGTGDGEVVFKPVKSEGFQFACYPGIKCFNRCCAKLVLQLTSYDIYRLTKHLMMPSLEFLETYTTPIRGMNGYPMVLLRMNEDDARCPFVTQEGCKVYQDRPAACRLYPLGRASRMGVRETGVSEEHYFTVHEAHCHGFDEAKKWNVQEWISNQGFTSYLKFNDQWQTILSRKPFSRDAREREKKIEMFYLAGYRLDDFAKLLSSDVFTTRFTPDVNLSQTGEVIVDERLLSFAYQWLRFSLFGEPTVSIRG